MHTERGNLFRLIENTHDNKYRRFSHLQPRHQFLLSLYTKYTLNAHERKKLKSLTERWQFSKYFISSALIISADKKLDTFRMTGTWRRLPYYFFFFYLCRSLWNYSPFYFHGPLQSFCFWSPLGKQIYCFCPGCVYLTFFVDKKTSTLKRAIQTLFFSLVSSILHI